MSAFRSCLLHEHLFGIIPRPSFWWDHNSLKATSTGVLVSTRPSSVRWQAPKKSQVTAKLRLGGKAVQQLPRAALSSLIIQRMADSRCSMPCALAFVPWPVTQLLHVFSTFSFISPSCDLCRKMQKNTRLWEGFTLNTKDILWIPGMASGGPVDHLKWNAELVLGACY